MEVSGIRKPNSPTTLQSVSLQWRRWRLQGDIGDSDHFHPNHFRPKSFSPKSLSKISITGLYEVASNQSPIRKRFPQKPKTSCVTFQTFQPSRALRSNRVGDWTFSFGNQKEFTFILHMKEKKRGVAIGLPDITVPYLDCRQRGITKLHEQLMRYPMQQQRPLSKGVFSNHILPHSF